MGRDISFVVVPKKPQHEPLKLCVNLNYELDGDDADCFMCVHFPEARSLYSAKSDNREKLCRVCAWFMNPMVDKETEPMILDELSCTYYYTTNSPVYSSCNIFNLIPLYEPDNSYIQSLHNKVYLVTHECISALESNIERYDKKYSEEGDNAALYDSKCVLSFLKTWIDKDDVKLLCFR
jgi:hypothetical protein